MRTLLSLLIIVSLALLGTACVDPDTDERFQQYLDRTEDQRAPVEETPPSDLPNGSTGEDTYDPGEACEVMARGDEISGTYLVGLNGAAVPSPILFETVIQSDGAELSISLQALVTAEREDTSGTAFAATGDALTATTTVTARGEFVFTVDDAVIPGDSNPLRDATIIAPFIEIVMIPCGADRICGEVLNGTATAPLRLPLRRYTLGGTRVDGTLQNTAVFDSCASIGD